VTTDLLVRPDHPAADIVDDATRRDFLIGVVAAGLIAACGGDGDGGADNAGRDDPGDRTRTIEHAGGTAEVPLRAARVVTLSEALDGHLTSVGLAPVGAVTDVQDWLAPYESVLDPDLALGEIADIGFSDDPNLEVITRLSPDLILAEVFSEDLYGTLTAIAPTVLVDRVSNAAWKGAFDQTVTAAGRQDEAAGVRSRYDAAVAGLRPAAAGIEVAFLRTNADGLFLVDGTGGFAGSVAEEAGFAVTDAPAGVGTLSEAGFVEVSNERLDIVTADVILVPDQRGDIDTIAAFEANPLWASLPAVRAGRVVAVPNPVYNGGTYVAAELLLAALAALADATG
jgi:iron complex transport system substrate-binding protein